MIIPNQAVQERLEGIGHRKRQRDAATLLDLMRRVTGKTAQLWGSVIGFGQYHYRYASGREGDAPAAAFSPRKAATTVYVQDGTGAHADLLARLGPHTIGVGCLYIKDLEAVDLQVLEEIVAKSYAALTAGTYTSRARESGQS